MELYFVTHNKSKFQEAKEIGENYSVNIEMYDLEYEEIQDKRLETIALMSCKRILEEKPELKDKDFFLEDAGLFIESLNGFPGPYSSYVFKTIGNKGILKLMKGEEDRKAHFKSVIAYHSKNEIKTFIGETEGKISNITKGEKGFGFDPIFIPNGYDITYAEMTLETKNLYSHRQKSLRELLTSITAFAHKKNRW
ncbi:MAG: XTP/dITP diphosphatase [Candidatus Thorarchaeota archaeon]